MRHDDIDASPAWRGIAGLAKLRLELDDHNGEQITPDADERAMTDTGPAPYVKPVTLHP